MAEKVDVLKVRCPRCGTKTAYHGNACRPFCSTRCQQLDLGAWAEEDYRIAGDPVPDSQDEDI